jgi:hypothetical protein
VERPVAGAAPAKERLVRDRRRGALSLAGLGALLGATGGVGLLALLAGWLLGAALWGHEGAAPPPTAVLVRLPPLAVFAPATPTPLPTPTLMPTPVPPPPPSPVLATRRLVTYYGNPLSDAMGVLGEGPPEQMVRRLRQQAAAYEADGRPVQPALHLIATVAQASPGADGLYRLRMPPELIEELSALALRHEMLLVLDVQVGRSSVQAEVEALRPFLVRQHVHLALDPEFAMGPTGTPGQQIGSLAADDINWAIAYLAEIAVSERLAENKVLIVHQFADTMIVDREALAYNERVDVAICMDGFGSPAVKIGQYARYVATAPVPYAAIKLFYRQDRPLLSPAEVLGLVPVPDIVVYQ